MTLEALTTAELETLAKVAKVRVKFLKIHDTFCIVESCEEEYWDIWEPQQDRNQIAMILRGMSGKQKAKYLGWMRREQLDNVKPFESQSLLYFGLWMQTVDPSISARAILKTLEQEKV